MREESLLYAESNDETNFDQFLINRVPVSRNKCKKAAPSHHNESHMPIANHGPLTT